MRRWILLVLALLTIAGLSAYAAQRKMIPRYNSVTKTWRAYPEVSFHDIQYVTPESLLACDNHQIYANVTDDIWTKQASPYALRNDTVVITALVTVPPSADPPYHGITYTQHGWDMLIHDVNINNHQWASLFVRVGSATDTAQARSDGFMNVHRGDIIQITGLVQEFPAGYVNSSTQIDPVPGVHVDIISSDNPEPEPVLLPISTFYLGPWGPTGKIMYSTGEQYEYERVEFVKCTVHDIINTTRGTWNNSDADNNQISDYDISYYWTIGSSEVPPIAGDPGYKTPPQYGTIDTIKGVIWTASGQENPRGYRICPMWPGDVIYGTSMPVMNAHRRYPVTVTSYDIPHIQARAFKIINGNPIASVYLNVSVNWGEWQERLMPISVVADSLYQDSIAQKTGSVYFPYPEGTNIRYFFKAIDDHGNSSLYANSSFVDGSDTSKGFFGYEVNDQPWTIRNVQYTPFLNGRSLYIGGKVTVHGVVTASANELPATAPDFGTGATYIQDGNAPWSGIWVVKDTLGNPAQLDSLALGDSVVITGTVGESNEVTRITDSLVTVIAHNRPVPEPVTVSSRTIGGAGNGDPVAESYEGMLVRVINAHVKALAPHYPDLTEFDVRDDTSSTSVTFKNDGLNTYSINAGDTAQGKTLIYVGDRVDTMIGIVYYTNRQYMPVPRTNSDFKIGDPVTYGAGWNMISLPKYQKPVDPGYRVTTLYSGASSPAFSYGGAYHVEPSLYPGAGYWIKFPSARTTRFMGIKVTNDSIPVVQSWNLVGALSAQIATSSVVALPEGNHIGVFFKYTSGVGYGTTTTLDPGYGYWVKADAAGTIVENSGFSVPMAAPPAQQAERNSITIGDDQGNRQVLYFAYDESGKSINLRDYEMPPAMFASKFDARYASGRILESYTAMGAKTARNYPIQVGSSSGVVTVSWNIVDKSGFTFTLGGKALAATSMKGTGTIKNVKLGGSQLVLTIGGNPSIPKEFYLSQNYPNPFNPSTRMEIGLPEASHLKVAVYNVLGQQVCTVADDNREAGVQTLVWNGVDQGGKSVASGIYFVRMEAGKFSQVRKIMLLK